VKLAPDLSDVELDDALEAILRNGMDGVIATNTTITRDGLKSAQKKEMGGLSGNPLRARSIEIVQKISKRTEGNLPIVGVGGISRPEHARAMLGAGASLVQIYSGLVYAGPGLVKKIVQELNL
jgi:dihydroorotate dehydrogenase